MHIAYISHEYPPDTGKGGIGTYTFQMARIMHDLGHDVEVFTASFSREITEVYNEILTHRVKINKKEEFKIKVLHIFKQQHLKKSFDIIECPEIGGEAELIKKQFSEISLIVRLHTPAVLVTKLQNTYTPFKTKLRYLLGALKRGKFDLGYWSRQDKNQYNDPDFLITQKASIITVPSKAMKNWAVKFWRISSQRIEVIPNPYEPTQELLSLNNEEEHKRITFLGRLNSLKGVVELTKAIPIVLNKYPDWKFLFIGNSEESHIKGIQMQQWIEQQLLKYREQIEFVGWVDYSELPYYYSQTDIVVIPSLFESFSYVCAEAMSAGKAIVGSNKSAMIELLDNGKYGILVNPYKYKNIARAIIKLVKNTGLRKDLGKNARQQVKDKYNKVVIGKQMENMYLSQIYNYGACC